MTEDEARHIVRQIAEQDRGFRAFVAGRRLTLAGSGVSTIAFFAGPDHVVRVTETTHNDCDVLDELFETKRGAHVGWPRIYDLVHLEDGLCVAVVERVKTFSKEMSPRDRMRLGTVVDRVVYTWEGDLPEPKEDDVRWDDQQWEWFRELLEGLSVVDEDREAGDYLDASMDNVGITKSGRAVWIDFGI